MAISSQKPLFVRVAMVSVSFLIAWAILSTATYFGWVRGVVHRDFFPWWAASRLALFDNYELYQPETTTQMQIVIYGAPLPPEIDQQAYHYPAQMTVELFPFWFIPDMHVGAAVWEGLSILMIIVTLYLLRNTWGNAPLWLIIPAFLWQYTLFMLYQAQVTALPMMALGIGFWLIIHNYSIGAGIILGLGLVKPELALIPTLVVLGIGLKEKNWRFLISFFSMQILLLAISIGLFGWWIPRWISAVRGYNNYAQSAWVPQTAWAISPILAIVILTVIVILLVKTRWTNAVFFAASIPLGVLLLPQTPMWNLTILLPTLLMVWHKNGRWAVASVWLMGWLLMFFGDAGPSGWRVQTMIISLMTLAAVTYTSRLDPINRVEQSLQPLTNIS